MDHKILFFVIFMTRSSFQDKVWNPYCKTKGSLEPFDQFCCPKCTQETNKEKCRYECPMDYYRFGTRCYGILNDTSTIEHSMPFSPFVCNRKCPQTHYGLILNETKRCVSCSILCLDTSIETSCSCAVSEKEIDIKIVLIITNIITALLFIAVTCISISCFYRKRKKDKRNETESMENCIENHHKEVKVEQLHKINDKITVDTEHKAEKDIAVAAQRQHEKITRYTPYPTVLRKKKEKEEHERVKSSDYANVSAIRINKILNRKTVSRAVSQFFGRKQVTHNIKFIEDVVTEHNTTPTKPIHGDSPSNKAFGGQVGEFTGVVSSDLVPNKVSGNEQHVPGNEHHVPTVIKTTQLSKSILQESKNINDELDNRDTTNIQSKTGNSTPNTIDPLKIKNIASNTQNANKLLHSTNRNDKSTSVSTSQTQRENDQKDETVESIKQVTFAAETIPTTKFEACNDKKVVPISDQTTNELYENYTFEKTEISNLTASKWEEQTDLNFVRRNKNVLRIADRGSKTSTNSNKSTISNNSKSTESDVSNLSFKTAPSESPRLSEVEDIEQYLHNEDTVEVRSSSTYTEEKTVYENIPYLSEMEANLKQHSESHTTERNELDNCASTDTNNYSVEELTPISENVEDNQLVTGDNRVSSGSDGSFHSIHNQCLDLESQDAMVKTNVRYNAITATEESIDMKTITSQTNMSFNNSTVNLVINQSN